MSELRSAVEANDRKEFERILSDKSNGIADDPFMAPYVDILRQTVQTQVWIPHTRDMKLFRACPLSVIPPDALARVACEFLLKGDVGRLDLAFTNKTLRPIWLYALKIMLSPGNLHIGSAQARNCVLLESIWLLTRQVPVNYLWLPIQHLTESLLIGPPLRSIMELHIQGFLLQGFAFDAVNPPNAIKSIEIMLCRSPNLKRLIIDNAKDIPPESMRAITSCPQLSAVSFDGACHSEVMRKFVKELSPFCHQITDLKIKQNISGDYLDFVIGALPMLRKLQVAPWTDLNDTVIEQLVGAYPLMTHLALPKARIMSNNGAKLLLSSFRFLHVLKIELRGDEQCILLSEHCKLLKDISIDGGHGVSDAGVTAIARGCKDLERISLNMLLIRDITLKAIGEHCSRILYLSCTNCSWLSLGCVLNVAKAASSLEEVHWEGTSSSMVLTWDGISYIPTRLAISGRLNIKRITLRNVRFFDGEILRKIAQNCPFLTDMILAACHDIDFSYLDCFHSLAYLRTLKITYCNVDTATLEEDLRRLKTSLPRVNIEYTSNK